jgi:hypothetical protein
MVQDLGGSKDSHGVQLRIESCMVRAFALESLGIGKDIIWGVLQSRYMLTVLCPQLLLSMVRQVELAVVKFNLATIGDISSIELASRLICNKARQSGFSQRVHPVCARSKSLRWCLHS